MKQCKKCGQSRPLEDFYRAAGTKDGLRGECKSCSSQDKRRRYLADPEAAIARVKRWQQANPERVNATQRARRAKPEAKLRERAGHLMRKYGMTIEQYDAMLEAQSGGCFICSRPPREDISLHVDHDHATGKVRGILCFRCNNALADFGEDPDILRKAASYVSWHANQEEIQLARQRARSLVGGGL
ncbi:MAG: endonuclease VII domain-containing protein [Actinomycetota bacterium]|nr:endonuclease VII domain-containing protein [Actinomycetota bacterium]